MTSAIEGKRLTGSSPCLLLLINRVILFFFSKQILISTTLVLLEITKNGRKYLPIKIIIQKIQRDNIVICHCSYLLCDR
ncbi:hypothetical protein CRN75_04880 [Yersinia frederiksenii]|nr:hypothetical protein CRN75_04880 [Yersinia frederiksenii]